MTLTSEWEQWDFYRVRAGKLIHAAKWHEYMSVRDPDVHSTTVQTYGKDGKEAAGFDIRDPSNEKDDFEIAGPINATIKVIWSKRKHPDPSWPDMELGYIFEKLSGVPRDLFRCEDFGKSGPKLENLATIRVNGDAEAVELLSPTKTKRRP